MDFQCSGQIPDVDDLERKAEELISHILSLCEERIRGISPTSDPRASGLAVAAMAARNAVRTFLALARI